MNRNLPYLAGIESLCRPADLKIDAGGMKKTKKIDENRLRVQKFAKIEDVGGYLPV